MASVALLCPHLNDEGEGESIQKNQEIWRQTQIKYLASRTVVLRRVSGEARIDVPLESQGNLAPGIHKLPTEVFIAIQELHCQTEDVIGCRHCR